MQQSRGCRNPLFLCSKKKVEKNTLFFSVLENFYIFIIIETIKTTKEWQQNNH